LDLILIGAGGHAKSCIACVEAGEFTILGLLDLPSKVGFKVCGYSIVGTDDAIKEFAQRKASFLITLGQIDSAGPRKRLFDKVKAAGGCLATVSAADAFVSASAWVGEGTIFMHRAVANAESRIGVNCIVNTAAIIEHDAIVGEHVHVSTGAIINGSCVVGDECFIGSGAILKEGVRIVGGTIVGAGSVVIKDIPVPGVYAGVPAKAIRQEKK
jgi:sugar O-acyltransferase (sialic acid O-acetyltransferase NeuD family)